VKSPPRQAPTSLNYLILIDAIGLLPRLYGRIVISVEVLNELIDDGVPRRVIEWR